MFVQIFLIIIYATTNTVIRPTVQYTKKILNMML